MRPSSVVLGFAVFAFACRSVTAPDTGGATFAYDFSTGAQGWTSGSSDYGIPIEPEIDLVADWRPLPAPLDQTSHALYIAGSNLSGDLFMFYKKQVDGLSPGHMYVASVTAEIATNIPHGCFGLGGAPGESAHVKAGASNHEPMRVLVGMDYVMNISKGNQATSGSDAVVIGNMANSLSCDPAPGGGILFQWELKHLASAPDAVRVQPASDGSVWLLIGVDLAPIGRYELYVTNFSAMLSRLCVAIESRAV